ncbi:MAG: hypothetical protein ABI612_25435 [Betaproteobacteria bacterium]
MRHESAWDKYEREAEQADPLEEHYVPPWSGFLTRFDAAGLRWYSETLHDPFPMLPSIVARANRLLEPRGSEELARVAEQMQQRLDEFYDCERENWELVDQEPEGAYEDPDASPSSTSEFEALDLILSYCNTADLGGADGLRECHIYAVLAKWLAFDAVSLLRPASDRQRPLQTVRGDRASGGPADTLVLVANRLLQALDALTRAEHLQAIDAQNADDAQLNMILDAVTSEYEAHRKESVDYSLAFEFAMTRLKDERAKTDAVSVQVEAEIKRRQSAKARAAANKRHEDDYAVRAQFLQWYQDNAHRYATKVDVAIAAMKLFAREYGTLQKWMARLRAPAQMTPPQTEPPSRN